MSEKIAIYGGTFDPPHNGHLAIARSLCGTLELDRFVFIPAFHAPHKRDKRPTSPFHRFAMLSLATMQDTRLEVSTIELDDPEHPYTFQTLSKMKEQYPESTIFFVIGADSWQEITTWVEWEKVLTMVGIIVAARPGHEIETSHVSEIVRERIVDMRDRSPQEIGRMIDEEQFEGIIFTNSVQFDIAATDLRSAIATGDDSWRHHVPSEVAKYIEKYQIYT